MTAEIIEQTKQHILINWSDPILGFGQLTMVWDDNRQEYVLDAELMSIDTVLEIFQALKEKK